MFYKFAGAIFNSGQVLYFIVLEGNFKEEVKIYFLLIRMWIRPQKFSKGIDMCTQHRESMFIFILMHSTLRVDKKYV